MATARGEGGEAGRWADMLVVAMLVFAMLSGCQRTPDEQQVRKAIGSAASAARANDARGVLAVVSDGFEGNGGEFDRHGLRQLLAVRALRGDRTGILIGPVAFERRGDRILASFNLVLTGGKPGDLLPERSEILAMRTAWRREGGIWLCYNATWRRFVTDP